MIAEKAMSSSGGLEENTMLLREMLSTYLILNSYLRWICWTSNEACISAHLKKESNSSLFLMLKFDFYAELVSNPSKLYGRVERKILVEA